MVSIYPPPEQSRLMKVIIDISRRNFAGQDTTNLFSDLLQNVLDLTGSEYGFIGEVFRDKNGRPYIKSYATTNIAWNDETQRLYEKTREKGMIFSRLNCLYGAVLTTGNLIISNDPADDGRSCGLPPGHPPLDSFMGVPLQGRDGLLGMVGVANRPGGYTRELARLLEPFMITCGRLLQSWRDTKRIKELEEALQACKKQLHCLGESIPVGGGFRFDRSSVVLFSDRGTVLLSRKELDLLCLLVENAGKVVPYEELKQCVWREVVVGHSSLRDLVRRIRIKAPGIRITTVRGVGLILTTPTDG